MTMKRTLTAMYAGAFTGMLIMLLVAILKG